MLRTTSRWLALALGAALSSAHPSAQAADGALDPTYGSGGAAYLALDGIEGQIAAAFAAAPQTDGKLVVAGMRNWIDPQRPFDPHMRAVVARFDANGAVDAPFGGRKDIPGLVVLPDVVPGTQQQIAQAVAVLVDGSIVVAGRADAFGPRHGFLAKLAPDGSLDQSFGARGIVLVPGVEFWSLAMDSQQRLVVGGHRTGSQPLWQGLVARFLPDGSLDASFAGDGIAELVDADPEQLGYVYRVAVMPDDRIVAAGEAGLSDPALPGNYLYDFSLARLQPDGTLDASFADGGRLISGIPGADTAIDGIDAMVLERSGAIGFAGHFDAGKGGNNQLKSVLGRVTAEGKFDAAFGDPATPGVRRFEAVGGALNEHASGLVRQSDGKWLLTVRYELPDGDRDLVSLRFDASGAEDPSYGLAGRSAIDLAHGGVYDDANALVLVGGRPLLAGASMQSTAVGLTDLSVARLDSDLIYADRFED